MRLYLLSKIFVIVTSEKNKSTNFLKISSPYNEYQ